MHACVHTIVGDLGGTGVEDVPRRVFVERLALELLLYRKGAVVQEECRGESQKRCGRNLRGVGQSAVDKTMTYGGVAGRWSLCSTSGDEREAHGQPQTSVSTHGHCLLLRLRRMRGMQEKKRN